MQRAVAFDNAVIANASQISRNYSDVVSLAARQTMASLDLTVSLDSDGNVNSSDVRIFMKDIGAGTILNPPTQCVSFELVSIVRANCIGSQAGQPCRAAICSDADVYLLERVSPGLLTFPSPGCARRSLRAAVRYSRSRSAFAHSPVLLITLILAHGPLYRIGVPYCSRNVYASYGMH